MVIPGSGGRRICLHDAECTCKESDHIDEKNCVGTVTDYISDSFYLVTPEGIPLQEGDWITKDGVKTESNAWNAVGQVCRDTKGWFVKWTDQNLGPYTHWTGKLYLKAKEDFIGGNAIDTNKSATIEITKNAGPNHELGIINLETPTVNVRLLPIGKNNSEETVFLGDTVNPETRLSFLRDQIKFTKIKSGAGTIYNRVETAEGLEADSFALSYAMGALTQDQWNTLLAGQEVRVDYTYDDPSSHGAVGYFTLKLTKAGESSKYEEHATTITGIDVETYTLTVDYTAYKLGIADQSGRARPVGNVHNGTAGPGTEVGGQNAGGSLETGKGVLNSMNIHKVHVVDGKITVIKKIEDSLIDREKDQTFTFTLYRLHNGEYEKVTDENGNAVTPTVTVEKDVTTGTAFLDTLPRGTYKLVETASEVYNVKSMTVLTGKAETNCKYEGSGTTEVTFTIGTDQTGAGQTGTVQAETDQTGAVQTGADQSGSDRSGAVQIGTNVIQIEDPPEHSSLADGTSTYIYSTLRGSTPDSTEACKSVSYGTVEVLNEKTIYTAEIPVEKKWYQVPESEYSGLTIYVALYKNGTLVAGTGNRAQTLALNSTNSWKGSFTVPLDHKGQDVSALGYSIRELSGVKSGEPGSPGSNSAVVVNVEENAENHIITYEKAVESGLVEVGDLSYTVTYQIPSTGSADSGKNYQLTVTNSMAFRLPETGGSGTAPYTVGGLTILTAAGILLLRNKKKCGKEETASF